MLQRTRRRLRHHAYLAKRLRRRHCTADLTLTRSCFT
jgi:hypothetical protein